MSASTHSPVLIVGLGNPGPRYAGTRHNIGVAVIDELCSRVTPLPATLSVHKRTNTEIAEVAAGRLGAESRPVILARTRSFMNLSGGPVKALATYFKVATADIVVAYDDLELDFGRTRLRLGGGDHGHNGLRSITQALGTKDYQRLAVGVGRPPGRQDPAAFVLKAFTPREQTTVPIMCADAADLAENLVRGIPTA